MAPSTSSKASKARQDPARQHIPHRTRSVTNLAHASTDNKTTSSSPSARPQKRSHSDVEGEQRAHDDDDNDTIHVANDFRYRDHKRSRPVEWPLKSEETTTTRKENQTGRRNASAKSPSSRRQPKTKTNRPSRFVEESMKDRASAKPPTLYTGDDSDYERNRKQAREGHIGGQADTTSESADRQWYDAGIEPSRPSGMYRFGKAIVNAFNPIWHGIHGMWKDNKDEEAPPVESVLRERQVKAEKAYAELKKAGFKGTKGTPKVDMPTIKYEDTPESFPSAPNRDSGIDVDERSSAERKRDGHVFDTDETLMPPPPIAGHGLSASPMSDAPLSQRSSLHVRKSSFQSLKNVKSHIQLPSAKKTPAPATPMSNTRKSLDSQALKKQPSKKELRLSKKVSNLETKLEHARRELRLAMGDAPPVPDLPMNLGLKPFKPGAMPSLPSGLIVDGHDHGDKSMDAEGELQTTGSAAITPDLAPTTTHPSVTTPPAKVDASIAALADVLLQSIEASEEPNHEKPTPQQSTSKKRKSARAADNDVRYKPDSDNDDDFEWTLAKTVTPKRKPARPRKAPKVEQSLTSAAKELPSSPKAPRQSLKLSQPAPPAKPAAPSPPTHSVFDPTKVDRAKLLKMRTEPNPFVPFGKLSDDVINLRKEYPSVTDEQLVNYFTTTSVSTSGDGNVDPPVPEQTKPSPSTPASLSKTKPKNPINGSFAPINNALHAALLGPPRSISPAKNRDGDGMKIPKRAHSPPPGEENSGPAGAGVKIGDEEEGEDEDEDEDENEDEDEVVMLDPSKDKDVPPMPTLPLRVEPAGANVNVVFENTVLGLGMGMGMRMRKVREEEEEMEEEEEYEWPADVF